MGEREQPQYGATTEFFELLLFLQVVIAKRQVKFANDLLFSVQSDYITFLSQCNRNAWEIQAAVFGEREQPQYGATTEFFELLLFLQVVIAKRPSKSNLVIFF